MNSVDIIGLGAGAFVLMACYCRRAAPLRFCAIISNLLFAAYGFLAGVMPLAILHVLLLPLNLVRLVEARNEGARRERRGGRNGRVGRRWARDM